MGELRQGSLRVPPRPRESAVADPLPIRSSLIQAADWINPRRVFERFVIRLATICRSFGLRQFPIPTILFRLA